MRRLLLLALCAIGVTLAGADSARAQETPPVTRYVAVTSFQVPFADRADFISWLEEYFLPSYQLNPKVLNFRLLNHNWGSNGADMALVAEYATWDDVNADCGAPCEAYDAQHEAPEEGDDGYAEYQKKLAIFNKYYAEHRDEIYATPMRRAVVEGQLQGTAGPTPPTPSN